MNAPAGLSIESIIPVSSVKINIALQFNGTDFVANIPNFHINISSSVLTQTSAGNLSTSSMTIFAYTTDPTAVLTSDSVLTEYGLDRRKLSIDLAEVAFIDYKTLKVSDFKLVNYPAGLSITSVTGISAFRAILGLRFTYKDFDTDLQDFYVDSNGTVLISSGTEIEVLSTNQLPILAYIEHPIATLTADPVLTEQNLDERTLTINLSDEEFIDHQNLQVSNFTLINAPTGLSINSVAGISKTQAVLDLKFNGTDFDVNYPDFAVTISKSVLIQSQIDLQTNSLTIFTHIEEPVAILTWDSVLTEYWLDYRTLYIDLQDETFTDFTTFVKSDFTLNNAPVGLSLQSVEGTSSTHVILNLAFVYNDFDTIFNHFM